MDDENGINLTLPVALNSIVMKFYKMRNERKTQRDSKIKEEILSSLDTCRV